MSIGRLGIRNNNRVLRLYIVCWSIINGIVVYQLILWRFKKLNDRKGNQETALRFFIAYTFSYIFMWIFSAALDLLVLYSYYRLSQKLSARATVLVTETLRTESRVNSQSWHRGS